MCVRKKKHVEPHRPISCRLSLFPRSLRVRSLPDEMIIFTRDFVATGSYCAYAHKASSQPFILLRIPSENRSKVVVLPVDLSTLNAACLNVCARVYDKRHTPLRHYAIWNVQMGTAAVCVEQTDNSAGRRRTCARIHISINGHVQHHRVVRVCARSVRIYGSNNAPRTCSRVVTTNGFRSETGVLVSSVRTGVSSRKSFSAG